MDVFLVGLVFREEMALSSVQFAGLPVKLRCTKCFFLAGTMRSRRRDSSLLPFLVFSISLKPPRIPKSSRGDYFVVVQFTGLPVELCSKEVTPMSGFVDLRRCESSRAIFDSTS